jgi:N-acylneuraminate cytidylyltransferase
MFDLVIVSTDDAEIADVARKAGADVPFLRRTELSDDYVGTNAVVRDALQFLGRRGAPPDYACCLYATAPFVQPARLREGYELLRQTGKSFAFSVTTYPFPIQRALRIDASGSIAAVFPKFALTRSQDLDEVFHDAGQFYWGTASAFLGDVPLFSAASVPVILPRHLVQDIDTVEDWTRAEYMYKVWRSQSGGSPE